MFCIDSAKITAGEVPQILTEQYGISCSVVKHLYQVDPVVKTNCSNIFLAETEGGPILFKELLLGPTNANETFQLYKADIIDFLRENGVKTPHHYRTLKGDGFVSQGGHLLEVLEYLPQTRGINPEIWGERLQLAQELGKMDAALAKLITLRQDIQQSYVRKDDLYGTTLVDLEVLIREKGAITTTLIKDITKNVVPYPFHKQAIDVFFKVVDNQLNSLGFTYPSEVKKSLIHRDLHGQNVIFEKQTGNLTAILDFETLSWLPLLLDPAFSALQSSQHYDNQLKKPDINQWKKFLREWGSLNQGVEVDPAIAHACLVKDGINRTAYFVKERYVLGNDVNPAIILNHIAYINRITDLLS